MQCILRKLETNWQRWKNWKFSDETERKKNTEKKTHTEREQMAAIRHTIIESFYTYLPWYEAEHCSQILRQCTICFESFPLFENWIGSRIVCVLFFLAVLLILSADFQDSASFSVSRIFPVPLCESNIDCSTYERRKNAVHFWLQFMQSVELCTNCGIRSNHTKNTNMVPNCAVCQYDNSLKNNEPVVNEYYYYYSFSFIRYVHACTFVLSIIS